MIEMLTLDVLLLEDNPMDVRLLREALRATGVADFRIVHAEGLAEALSHMEHQHFDVVLTDLSVPDSFGLNTAEAILAKAGETPVVVLTGSGDDETGLAAVQLGAQDYLVKGETSDEAMLRSLQYAIERKQTEVALRQTNEQLAEHVKKQLSRYHEALHAETFERYRIEAALRESESRFRATFEQNVFGMCHVDKSGVFLRVNARLCEILGYDESELLSMSLATLAVPEDGNIDAQQRQRLLHSEIRAYAVDRRCRKKDGGIAPLRQHFSLMRDERGEPAYFVVVFEFGHGFGNAESAAGRVDFEQRLATARNALEVANAELDGLFYSISHDLRAPVRAISGFSRILIREHGDGLTDAMRHYLELIGDGAQRLDYLFRDLLAYARLGRHAMRWRRVELGNLAAECWQSMQPDCEGREVEFTVGALPTVDADPVLLKLLFLALIGNALKFTKNRDPARIDVGAGSDGIYVRDNGAGFEMRHAQRVFGVFRRLHRDRDDTGTGIGLAIAQRIVQRHGGRIWAESTPDSGATFFFTLPERAAALADGAG